MRLRTRSFFALLIGLFCLAPSLLLAQSESASSTERLDDGRDPNAPRPHLHAKVNLNSAPRDVTRTLGSDSDERGGSIRPEDQVILDNLIIKGSACAGQDCVNGEAFGFDTIRLKENNLRIHFQDTSTSGSFPTNDWRIIINDNTDGGANYFGIEDSNAGRMPFLVEAGAPANALYVESDGDVGIGTANPVVDAHVVSGNTPALRLEQNGSSGFNPQTWDIAGNESNFFIRDASNVPGLLPFRVLPGAPTNSLVLKDGGTVGIGTNAPTASLHLYGTAPTLKVTKTDGGTSDTFLLDGNGNLTLSGLLLESSSREVKDHLVPVNGDEVLERVSELDLYEWSYTADGPSTTHMGPMAEDFAAAFGLGADDKHVAALDVSGVALSAIQVLERKNREKDARIEKLEAQIAAQGAQLETERERLEQLSRKLAELAKHIEGK